MKRITLIFLTIALLSSCAKKEFTIEFDLAPTVDANYRVSYLDSKAATFLEFVAPVAGGKFKLKCPAQAPALVVVTPTGGGSPLLLLAYPGDKITLTGDNTNPFLWKVAGNDVDLRWSEWRLKNAAPLEHGGSKAVNKMVAEYVKANPKDLLSLILLLSSYDRSADEEGFRKLWSKIDKSLFTPGILASVNRADLFETVTAKLPPIPKEFPARYGDDSLITVRLADARTTLFWFRSDDDPGERAGIDSLRRFFRRVDDSKRLRLATVSFDADSTTMRRAARYDSVPSAFRLWEPQAETGSLAEKFAVYRLPCFVLVDSVGKVLYRGDSPSETLSALKNIK